MQLFEIKNKLRIDCVAGNQDHDSGHTGLMTWEPIAFALPESRSGDLLVEGSFHWPEFTVEAIRVALQNKVSRFSKWNFANLHEPHRKAWQKAAEIYKRGVFSYQQSSSDLAQSYDINICSGLDSFLKEIVDQQDSALIIDQNIFNLWHSIWNGKNNKQSIVLSVSEQEKSLSTAAAIAQKLAKMNDKSHAYIIGGGLLCDMAAFVCQQLGRSFTLIPTSFLAMIDASCGGKTGVNFFPFGKNLIGSFAFPTSVYIFPEWLQTLPKRELHSGLTESFKHALLSKEFFEISKGFTEKKQWMTESSILRSIEVKAQIVQADPFERQMRMFLNLGHTFGHGIESFSQDNFPLALTHGESVALGLVYCILLSKHLNYISQSLATELLKMMKNLDILPNCKNVVQQFEKNKSTWDELKSILINDKKAGAHMVWVLLKETNDQTLDPLLGTASEIDMEIVFLQWKKTLLELF